MRRVLGFLLMLQVVSGALLAVETASAFVECGNGAGVVLDLSTAGASGSINGAYFLQISPQSTTGKIIDPFVRIQRNGCEGGFNTSGSLINNPEQNGVAAGTFTRDLPLAGVPIVHLGGVAYRQFLLDLNEITGSPNALLSLDKLQVYQSNEAALQYLTGLTAIYDLDGMADRYILLNYDLNSSGGSGDLYAFIPNSLFGPETYVYVYSHFGDIADASDGFEEWSIARSMVNGAPTADADGPYLGAINTIIAFDGSGSFDPDGSLLAYAWSFGDGGTGSGAAPTHSYIEAGVYDVCLTVSDGVLSSEPHCTIAVAYDPEAGFVTGGGWFTSPEGAYKADPDLTGRATFGFVSKYRKGASVPSGDTQFQFVAGDLNFSSAAYEWLVVNQNGTTAQFKGVGTINGASDAAGNPYKFMLWATDGNPDLFRIRIWEEDAFGAKSDVYDNGVAQAISGGGIVVHTGGGGKNTSGIPGAAELDGGFRLDRPSPNPFSGTTRVAYTVGGPNTRIDIDVFDLAGRRVRNLVSGVQGQGHYTAAWDGLSDRGERVAKGVYFLAASVGGQKQVVRVAHLR